MDIVSSKKMVNSILLKNNASQKAVELTGVTEALVIPTTEEGKNLKYNVLVVKKTANIELLMKQKMEKTS